VSAQVSADDPGDCEGKAGNHDRIPDHLLVGEAGEHDRGGQQRERAYGGRTDVQTRDVVTSIAAPGPPTERGGRHQQRRRRDGRGVHADPEGIQHLADEHEVHADGHGDGRAEDPDGTASAGRQWAFGGIHRVERAVHRGPAT
jgi:hypothetical protein